MRFLIANKGKKKNQGYKRQFSFLNETKHQNVLCSTEWFIVRLDGTQNSHQTL